MNGVGTAPITTSLLSENNIEKERKMKKIFSCIAAVWMLASCDPVTDPVKATGIEIRPSSVTLEIGKTEELTFAVLPEQAVQKVLWESSNEKIVTVKEGKVTAIAAGKAEVKAVVAENKSLTAVCTVTVTEPVPESLNLETDVPDAAFRAVLKKFDTDSDGIVSRAEADAVTELIYEEWEATIIDLTGIAFFTNLETLSVQGERLESVDLSGNRKLKHIDLRYNAIRELDLTALDQLQEYKTNTAGAVVYGLQIGHQGESYSDKISVILSDVYKDVWDRIWSQPVSEYSTPNQGVTVTFR